MSRVVITIQICVEGEIADIVDFTEGVKDALWDHVHDGVLTLTEPITATARNEYGNPYTKTRERTS